jgi:hypothetical protein
VLREAGHAVTTDTVLSLASTLRTVLAAGNQAGERLAEARLLTPAEAPHGFGFGQDEPVLTVLQGRESRPGFQEAATATPRHEDRVEPAAAAEADAARRRAQAAATTALRAAEAAEQDVSRRQAEVERARQRAGEVRTRLQAMQQELSAAEDGAEAAAIAWRDAVQRARAARREADRTEADRPG